MVEVLGGGVIDADFESDCGDVSGDEGAFEFEEEKACEASAAVFGGDADGGDMSDAVGFDDGDGESDHLIVSGSDLSRDGIRIGEQVAEGFAFVGFAVDEAAEVELP